MRGGVFLTPEQRAWLARQFLSNKSIRYVGKEVGVKNLEAMTAMRVEHLTALQDHFDRKVTSPDFETYIKQQIARCGG